MERCLRKSLAIGSIFLKHALNFLKSGNSSNDSCSEIMPEYGFDIYHHRLSNAIYVHGFPSMEAAFALNELRAFSLLPRVEVTAKGVWDHVALSVWTHLKSTFDNAAANIESTGRVLTPEDRKYLQLLLTHGCGWSATYPEQMNAHWATFFKTCYPHLNGLTLILDNMAYPEEFKDLPDGMTPDRADIFLLATSESYYVYDCSETLAGTGSGLSRAGQTLEKVYLGMREWKYCDVEDAWEIEEPKVWVEPSNYFPRYYRNEEGIYINYEA